MCGSSGGGTSAPPSPPPTTFSYTAADNSNAQRRQAQMVGATDGPAPGTVLGNSGGGTGAVGPGPENTGKGGIY